MALTEQEKVAIWAKFMSLGNSPGDISKADVRAAVDAIDTFFDNNIVAINNAFPLPFRTSANAAQKAFLVGVLALRRAGIAL